MLFPQIRNLTRSETFELGDTDLQWKNVVNFFFLLIKGKSLQLKPRVQNTTMYQQDLALPWKVCSTEEVWGNSHHNVLTSYCGLLNCRSTAAKKTFQTSLIDFTNHECYAVLDARKKGTLLSWSELRQRSRRCYKMLAVSTEGAQVRRNR